MPIHAALPLSSTRWLAAGLLLALTPGCSEPPVVSDCIPGIDPSCEEPPEEDETIAGVNVTALFATPTSAEVDAARTVTPPTSGTTTLALLSETANVRRYTLALDDGGTRILTALVRVPGASGQTSRLPTVLVLTDGTDGASEADLLTDPSFGSLLTGAVQIVVAYRGETLGATDAAPSASGVPADPYRADVGDVRALLAALPTIPRADATRIGIVGVGRGGTVALLTALQDSGIDAVVTLGAPTDLFRSSFRAEASARLEGATPAAPYPALDALVRPVLRLRDGQISRDEARLGLLALSPARLAQGLTLPAVYALHANGDTVVGEDQLASLRAVLTSTPDTPRFAELVDGSSRDELIRTPIVQSQIAAFLDQAL